MKTDGDTLKMYFLGSIFYNYLLKKIKVKSGGLFFHEKSSKCGKSWREQVGVCAPVDSICISGAISIINTWPAEGHTQGAGLTDFFRD